MMNPRRIIITIYGVVLVAFGVGAGAVLLDAHAQYDHLKQVEIADREKLANAQSRLREQERMLERLKSDPAYVERTIRQKLSYAKPGEVIFRFPD